eukprot:541554-Pelagomonas_calceolata.AAC.4
MMAVAGILIPGVGQAGNGTSHSSLGTTRCFCHMLAHQTYPFWALFKAVVGNLGRDPSPRAEPKSRTQEPFLFTL